MLHDAMTNFPPPTPGDFSPPPRLPPMPPEPPRQVSNRTRQAAVIAGLVAVTGLAAGGAYIITDDGENSRLPIRQSSSTDESATTESIASGTTTATTIVVPTTVAPTTPAPPEVTEVTAVGVPAGAVDLGLGVYFPLPAGWQITDDSAAPTISNGSTSLSLQALVRPPGEDPVELLQEYIDTFDADFDRIAYSPSETFARLEGPLPIDEYGMAYRIFSPSKDDGISTTGLAAVFQRGDGLSVVYDVFSTEGVYDVDGDSYATFVRSMLDAPVLDDAITLVRGDPFRITSVHEFVAIFGLAGYTPAPGWNTFPRPDGHPYAMYEDGEFEMRQFLAVGTVDGAVEAAKVYHLSRFPDVVHDPTVVAEPNYFGHERRDVSWTGTLNGQAISGVFSVFFDAVSGNSVAMYEDWFGAIPNPYEADFSFMFIAAADSFATI